MSNLPSCTIFTKKISNNILVNILLLILLFCVKLLMTTVLAGGACHILQRMEVMRMHNYDFKDLMAFGVFILALLTFIFNFCK